MTDGPALYDWLDPPLGLSTFGEDGAHTCAECGEHIYAYPAGPTAVLTCGCTPRLQLLIDRGAEPEAVWDALRERVADNP